MNIIYNYDFKIMTNFFEHAVITCLEIKDNKKYFSSFIYTLALTESLDKEIIAILTIDEEIEEIIKKVLELNSKRLQTKKAFHIYIEKNYPNSLYEEYSRLYEKYIYFIKDKKKEAELIIQNEIDNKLKELKILQNPEEIYIKIYKEKEFISNCFETSINEVVPLYEERTTKENRDYSKFNFLDSYRILWVESIREKHNQDMITKAIKKTKKTMCDKNKNGKNYYTNLPEALFKIATYTGKNIYKKQLIIFYLIDVFKNIELVKTLCTIKYKDTNSIMDRKTFDKKIKDTIFKNYI